MSRTLRASARSIAIATLGLALISGAALVSAPAQATSPPRSPTLGLFGTADPTYDGVQRQATAILGLHSVGVVVPPEALEWLIAQQCPNGSFAPFRDDLTAPCPPSDPANFTGPDTNATAFAALALHASGRTLAAQRAMEWLIAQRSPGGGWTWIPGGTPNTSSTGLVLAAITVTSPPGRDRLVREATAFLRRAEAPCTAAVGVRWGMPDQRGLDPDTFSGSQSLLGLADAFPVRERPQKRAVPQVACRDDGLVVDPGMGVARWIARQLNANDGALPYSYDPTGIDWNSTALSILGLVALRTAGIATDKAVAALADNIEDYIGSSSGDRPAALGTSLLVTAATGGNPRDFGGANLVRRLLDTLQNVSTMQ